jgi:hypothetical protein
MLDNRPWFGSGTDTLQKSGQLNINSGSPQQSGNGNGWTVYLDSHCTVNHLAGCYLLSGDWQMKRAIEDLAEVWMAAHTVGTGRPTDNMGQARAVWRSLQVGATLWSVTNNEALRAAVIRRTVDGVRAQWTPAQFPTAVVRPVHLENIWSTQPPGWSPYQSGGCAHSFLLAHAMANPITEAADRTILWNMMVQTISSNVEHAYEDQLFPPKWVYAFGVSFGVGTAYQGQPVNTGTAQDILNKGWQSIIGSGTSQDVWNQGPARLAGTYGSGAAQALVPQILQEPSVTTRLEYMGTTIQGTQPGDDEWACFYYTLPAGTLGAWDG